MTMNVRGWRALWLLGAFWLLLVCVVLLLAGCCRKPASVDVDALNAASQAELLKKAQSE